MPDIRQIAFDESSLNPYWQTCQTILRLVEMILRFCFVFTNDTVVQHPWWMKNVSANPLGVTLTETRIEGSEPTRERTDATVETL